MNWDAIEFCPSLSIDGRNMDEDAVSVLLARTLFSNGTHARDLFSARYRQMRRNYSDVPYDDLRWDLTLGTVTFGCEGVDKAALLPIPQHALPNSPHPVAALWSHSNFGHDMPTWMVKRSVKNPRRVMIVSQDSRRTGQPAGRLLLSTPFGFHSSDYRNICCQNSVICRFVWRLLDECDACVYLTDGIKFCADGIKPKHMGRQFQRTFETALHEEIALFSPDIVLALGDLAAGFCNIRPPCVGLDIQNIDNCRFVSAYHPRVRNLAGIRRFTESGRIVDYFNKVFNRIREQIWDANVKRPSPATR